MKPLMSSTPGNVTFGFHTLTKFAERWKYCVVSVSRDVKVEANHGKEQTFLASLLFPRALATWAIVKSLKAYCQTME